ncbi:MAG: hypothetical protein GY703_16635, partial [Gammaproteobacteria bacterium]|nr:hypothetical protein [Gammaproteobacteria bacterium]
PDAPEGKRWIRLKAGFNLFAYPGPIVQEHDTCLGLLASFGSAEDIQSIARFDTAAQNYIECDWSGQVDFHISTTEGYSIRSNIDKALLINDELECSALSIEAGVNQLSLQAAGAGYSCYQWLNDLGQGLVKSIRHFDTTSGEFQSCAYSSDGQSIVGDDFLLRRGEGYLIHATTAGSIPSQTPGCKVPLGE